ncbi:MULTISPECIES: hypothetical protein [unclassified Epibacterium]|jgi:hypothetical protein|uniref:hypothetical protein n=1 Tax=unclassified Epibacterium TaxID=2639179 RepID=UPI001EF44766|nr:MULTISPECIES: hypothetical protein [unclassified Epibacterium]MCG7624520.1 hypothetical protein [Epibacterium sp. Ofav1-8]MCG7627836.1 hypothetical protein [Epibacterium sp. MM17-32]
MDDFEEVLVDFDDTGAEPLFEVPAENDAKGIQYNAYCLHHKRSITGWTTSNSQIHYAIYYHMRSNPGHSIRVYQRVT